jgi:hypothetical protein
VYGFNNIKQLIQREEYMLNQFRTALQATLERLMNKSGSDQTVLEKLSEMLNDDNNFSWAMMNKVELSLVDCYDDVSLQTEWQRQIAVVDYLPEKLANFYTQHDSVSDTEKLRALLTCLIKDIQWAREAKRVIRFTEQQMRKKVVALFLIGFVLFFLPTILRAFFGIEFDNLRLYYIFTAASSGILGAAFSQLTSIQ